MEFVGSNRIRDLPLFITLICLLVFGELAIYSASVQQAGEVIRRQDYYLRQLLWIAIAIGLLFLIMYTSQAGVERLIIPFYLLVLILLILVLLLPGIKGVHRWITIGSLGIQPSEFAKLASILLIGKLISKSYMPQWKKIVIAFLVIIPPIILIARQPDLSTAVIMLLVCFPILYFAGVSLFVICLILSPFISILVGFSLPLWIIFDLILLILLYWKKIPLFLSSVVLIGNAFISFLAPYFWSNLQEYQRQRILAFLNPTSDVLGSGYQTIQSRIAVGSGGLLGKGFLQGTQKNFDFIPEQHTDFIFSVIGEETGFFGCTILILLFLLLAWRIILVLKRNQNAEQRIVIAGILSYIVIQAVLNIGMNIGIFPVMGIPLPFISYGGSSLLVNTAAIGLIIKFDNERRFIE
ncbi:MAG: rod shape-determining protein RodA [Candidatus Cloacimonadia bacterium]